MTDIYWLIAVVSSGLLGLMVLLNLFGFDIDELEIDGLGDAFSFNGIIAFLCVGGWTGYLAEDMTSMSEVLVLVTSAAAGAITYLTAIYFLNRLKGLEESGNINIENAIGKTGTVYLSIPGEMKGEGQIQIIVQGRLNTLYAKTRNQALETGTRILVYDIENDRLLVEKYNEEEL